MKCTVCGTIISDQEKYCPNCGWKLTKDAYTTLPTNSKRKWMTEAKAKVVAVVTVIFGVYSIISHTIDLYKRADAYQTPNEYMVETYGESYDYKTYDLVEDLAIDYPELAKEIQPYRDYVLMIKDNYERISENVYPYYGENIVVINGEIHSANFRALISDNQKDAHVTYELHYQSNDTWQIRMDLDEYNVKEEEINQKLTDYLTYVGNIIQAEQMSDVITELLESIPNYYRTTQYNAKINGYWLEFNYLTEGDYTLYLSKELTLS